jgi:hypothetical protein
MSARESSRGEISSSWERSALCFSSSLPCKESSHLQGVKVLYGHRDVCEIAYHAGEIEHDEEARQAAAGVSGPCSSS